jgi:hypothetical protein
MPHLIISQSNAILLVMADQIRIWSPKLWFAHYWASLWSLIQDWETNVIK